MHDVRLLNSILLLSVGSVSEASNRVFAWLRALSDPLLLAVADALIEHQVKVVIDFQLFDLVFNHFLEHSHYHVVIDFVESVVE